MKRAPICKKREISFTNWKVKEQFEWNFNIPKSYKLSIIKVHVCFQVWSFLYGVYWKMLIFLRSLVVFVNLGADIHSSHLLNLITLVCLNCFVLSSCLVFMHGGLFLCAHVWWLWVHLTCLRANLHHHHLSLLP